ncbi:MAG: CehA/McbA family metallohydrolase [Parvibaculaceae bacterium]
MTTHGDYSPLDFDPVRNSSVGLFEDSGQITIGRRVLHGLPFDFGSDRDTCVLRLAPGDAKVVLPLSGRPSWLIFAHAIEETDLFEHGDIGFECARYRLIYADGSVAECPLRQRYEIGPTPRRWEGRPIPLDWGHTPFLAVPETEQRLMHRSHGRYDEAGARLAQIDDPQARVPYVLPYRYYLWAMRNPEPGKDVRSLEALATSRTLLVGAITASTCAEEPFTRSVAEDVVVSLDRPVTEQIGLSVDRGLATYLHPCVAAGGMPGWGGPSLPVKAGYAQVAAAPSATLRILDGEVEIARCAMAELTKEGSVEAGPGISLRLVNRDRTWVRTTVTDAETGRLLPCRIRFYTADGVPVAPYGHQAVINSGGNTWNLDIGGDVRLGGKTYAQIDGSCEGWLPVGRLWVEVARGFEHEPLCREITIAPDERQLALKLRRIADLRSKGLVSADTHVHFVSSQGAELEARCEGVDIVHLLLSQWGHLHTSVEEFIGQPRHSSDGETIVFAGQENRSNALGHMHLLGARRRIQPWCTGGAEEAELGGGLETTLSHWADECRAEGGLVVLAHFPVPNGETAALVATGRADAIEMIAYDDYNIGEYYRYLNAGYRLPLVAGTDKMTAEVAIGQMRTYAQTGGSAVDLQAWCDAVRAGRTFVTSGPLLELDVNGAGPGAEIDVGHGADLRVTVQVLSIFPVDRIELIADGEVIARKDCPEGTATLTLEASHRADRPGWIAARCMGTGHAGASHHYDVWQRPVFAHTSPVYVRTTARRMPSDPRTTDYMLALCRGVKAHVEQRAARFWPGNTSHRHGESDHLAFLLRPIEEAIAILQENRPGMTE